MNIQEVQDQLQAAGIDGWLLYDFQGLNPIARKLLGLRGQLITRRWYYWIPKSGKPLAFCHKIEQQAFSSLNVPIETFRSWSEMVTGLEHLLSGARTVAMEYSPRCAIPYVSRVDAGTMELLTSMGKEVVTSANLIQYFEARWNTRQFQLHLEASRRLMGVLFDTLDGLRQSLRDHTDLNEFMVQQKMLGQYTELGLQCSSPPIVAVNQNSANPHYEPLREQSASISPGDFLLIDFWAKLAQNDSVYADYTWVMFLGESVPEPVQKIWDIVKGARDAAIDYVTLNHGRTSNLQGWQVDKVARNHISQRGYGESFVHRTGHSIGEEDHGNGANLDSLETKDERVLIPGTCFSIEPGVYLKDFGIRSEVNVYLDAEQVVVTGDPIQSEVLKIF
ncbi:MAG: M24 family metallopeptidase [Terriglobia bacterium]